MFWKDCFTNFNSEETSGRNLSPLFKAGANVEVRFSISKIFSAFFQKKFDASI